MILTSQQVRIKLFKSLKNSFFKKSVGIFFVLLLGLLITAFSLVVTRLHYKLQLDKQKDLIVHMANLEEEWSQIILEYSSLITPIRLDVFAYKNKMFLPEKYDIKFLNGDRDLVNEQFLF